MDALIQEAKDLCEQALSQADAALDSIHEAQRICDEVLNQEAA